MPTNAVRRLHRGQRRVIRRRRQRMAAIRGLFHAQLVQAKSASEAAIEEKGFSNLHRFVTEYWRFYGEMPPIRPVDPGDK